jgi:hypothetical protein
VPTERWGKKLYNVEPHDLYFMSNIIWVINARRIRWVGHVAHHRLARNGYSVLVRNLKEETP